MSGTGQPSQEAMNAPRAATHGAVPVPVAARAACAGGAHTARTTTSQRTPNGAQTIKFDSPSSRRQLVQCLG